MNTKCKWLKLFLVASLALNLAFITPYFYHRYKTPPSHPKQVKEKKAELKNGLNLQPDQKKKLDEIIKSFRLNMSKYKRDILEKRIAIIDELGDPEFDPDIITARTNELNKLENELNLLFVDNLVKINALLEPGQRLNFLYKLSKNWFFIDKKK
ncbi:MAG: periplasmic heavy metal sensor [Acidobacteria bacterium]|jgi:Spy/CpxP family protein refolding chaperone|nr:periplasmic heavy metal sensor [Acidobacteriota bacterium]